MFKLCAISLLLFSAMKIVETLCSIIFVWMMIAVVGYVSRDKKLGIYSVIFNIFMQLLLTFLDIVL